MLINNKELIEPHLIYQSDDEYYHLMILQRKKEHPALKINSHLIKVYFLTRHKSLDAIWNEAVTIADIFKARIYINLNPKSMRSGVLRLLQKETNRVTNGEYYHFWNDINYVAGETIAKHDKLWIIDVDDKREETYNIISDALCKCDPNVGENKIKLVIPTIHGYHYITTPFDRFKFLDLTNNQYCIQDNNPTLLYYNAD